MNGYARNTDPGSSHEAAGKINVTKLQLLVVQTLREKRVPMTSIDIAKHLGIHLVSISPRMKPLEDSGQIVCVGTMPALNSSGRIRNLRHYVIKDTTDA
jgi:hypothetical protein